MPARRSPQAQRPCEAVQSKTCAFLWRNCNAGRSQAAGDRSLLSAEIDVGDCMSERDLIDVTAVAQEDHRQTSVGKARQVGMIPDEIAAVFHHTQPPVASDFETERVLQAERGRIEPRSASACV